MDSNSCCLTLINKTLPLYNAQKTAVMLAVIRRNREEQ